MPEPRATLSRRRARRYLALGLVAGLVLLVADQVVQHTVLADGEFLGRRVAPYDPPIFCEVQRQALARLDAFVEDGPEAQAILQHDAELGWCAPRGGSVGGMNFDAIGARASGVEPSADRRRIVTIGCSFTLGYEVEDDETWQVALQELDDRLELVNLGALAYGVDQALLRYLRDGRPLAPDEVWLGFFPGASQRVTTLYRPALRHWARTILFKPRFVLERDGSLRLVPNPGTDLAETHRLLHDQDAFLEATRADSWVRRVPQAWSPRGASPLHDSGLARLALTALESRDRDPRRAIARPESETYRLTRALCLRLREEVEARGARFRLLILPGPEDLEDFRAGARPSWADWVGSLEAEGVIVHDLSPALDERDRAEPGVMWAPRGHYTRRANAWVAEELARTLEAEHYGDER